MSPRTSARASLAALAAVLLAGSALAGSAAAFNYVTDSSGTYWGIQDAAAPRVDTGSIRATQVAAGTSAAYSTTINGFGGIKVQVSTTPSPRFNGELMRGFGLKFDGLDRFDTTTAVGLGGVTIARSIYVNRSAGWTRWLDSFTNTTRAPITVKVAFGGQTGYGAAGANSSALVNTSSSDATLTAADSWAEVATPLNGTTPVGGPQATVIGTPGVFAGAMTFTGNWLNDTFNNPLATSGHEGNFQAYVNTITLPPGKTRSVAHFVVLGPRVDTTTSAAVRSSVEATATALAGDPELSDLSAAQICSIDNFDISALTIPGFDPADCASVGTVGQIPVPEAREPVTSSPYDVVDKTIGQLRADLESGRTTSQQITRAYLDRVAVYDQGQFGFNSYEYVAKDAMAQAKAADDARAAGKSSPVLGIPIAVKNLYDTKDMPTTNGSLTFEGFRPKSDAFQVARLRDAGAVIIGKAALEEYATSGSYSNDPWGQVWNAFNPSKSAIASSGGSATATAASLAAAALGSQTGDSLYGPASGASLVTLRGTDGLESGSGIMPLSWLTDFGGVMTRSVPDLADVLNVVTGTDAADPATAPADAHRPADWRSMLDPNALEGKRIGYVASKWVDPFGTTGTIDAEKAALQYLEQAGATIVPMGAAVGGADVPTVPANTTTGNTQQEGWAQYIDAHPELAQQGFPISNAVDVSCSQKKIAYVRADVSACAVPPAPRMTADEIAAKRAYRVTYAGSAKAWMDSAGVDAVVYPGLLSDISLNDGGGNKSSFGRSDTIGAAAGIPTVVFPAGYNDHGQPINIQLLGRAWDDAKLVGMAYAFEQRAQADGKGHVAPTTVPALTYKPGAAPQTITVEKPVASEPVVAPAPAPAPAKPPAVTARVRTTGSVSGSFARVVAINTSKATINGTLVLKGKAKVGGRTKTVTFGDEYFTIGAGKSRTIKVYLGPTARKALRGHTRFTVSARWSLTNASGGRLALTRSVTLTLPKTG